MSIDFNHKFGKNSIATSGAASSNEQRKAEFWINVGYQTDVLDSEGNARFVSLPVGIPLDAQEKLPTNSRNAEFAAFQAARNDLMEQVMAVAQALQPGEEKILNLQLQLRRINSEQPAAAAASNQFIRKLNL